MVGRWQILREWAATPQRTQGRTAVHREPVGGRASGRAGGGAHRCSSVASPPGGRSGYPASGVPSSITSTALPLPHQRHDTSSTDSSSTSSSSTVRSPPTEKWGNAL